MPTIDLRLGDCLDVMGSIPDRSIDLILADLPYGGTGCKWDVVIPWGPLWEHYRRLLTPCGTVVLTGSQPFTSSLVASNPEWFRYELIWDKSFGSNFQLANYQPLKVHENLIVFSPAPAVPTVRGESMPYHPRKGTRLPENMRPYPTERTSKLTRIRNGVTRRGKDYDPAMTFPTSILRYQANVAECNSSKRVHTSQKPIALMEYLIRTYSNEGDTVLDNVMGSGTTGVACLNTGRHFIGIEKHEPYFKVAERRIRAEVDRTALFGEQLA